MKYQVLIFPRTQRIDFVSDSAFVVSLWNIRLASETNRSVLLHFITFRAEDAYILGGFVQDKEFRGTPGMIHGACVHSQHANSSFRTIYNKLPFRGRTNSEWENVTDEPM